MCTTFSRPWASMFTCQHHAFIRQGSGQGKLLRMQQMQNRDIAMSLADNSKCCHKFIHKTSRQCCHSACCRHRNLAGTVRALLQLVLMHHAVCREPLLKSCLQAVHAAQGSQVQACSASWPRCNRPSRSSSWYWSLYLSSQMYPCMTTSEGTLLLTPMLSRWGMLHSAVRRCLYL